MTFFEYQTIMARIETTNSYATLRKIHTQLQDKPMDNFYIIHAINKVIKKFKEKTTSTIIRDKSYPKGTTSYYFNVAIQSAETKEQILLLLADFQGEKKIQLPNHTQSILHMVDLDIEYSDIKDIIILPYYYSVGQDDKTGLTETNRLPIAIICYLEPIKDTEIYTNLLAQSLVKFKHWNSTPTSLESIFNNMQKQIDKQEAHVKALKQAQILYKEITDDTSGDIPTT